MPRVLLELPKDVHTALLGHLLGEDAAGEQAAFVFAHASERAGDSIFRFCEWSPIGPEGFVHRSDFYLELADRVRGRVIKRAHDLGASLVEFHSHVSPWLAEFSSSDLLGLDEFVPHVWWRLKRKPYLAVVVAPSSFDALAWISGPKSPQVLDGILVENKVLKPTGLTIKHVNQANED